MRLRSSAVVAIAVAAASILMVVVALRTTWYHQVHTDIISTTDQEFRDEIQWSLDGEYIVYSDGKDFFSFEEGANFWEELEPMHSFTERLQIILTIGAVLSGLWATLVYFEKRLLGLAAGLGSGVLFGSAALIFYMGFGNAYTASDLPGVYRDFTEFFVNSTDPGFLTTTDVWGPMSGWWLAIAACIVQIGGLAVVAVLRRRSSRTARDTRPSLSPSAQPSDPSRQQ